MNEKIRCLVDTNILIQFEEADSTKESTDAVFRVYGTGFELDQNLVHLDTLENEGFVYHVYLETKERECE